MQVDDRDREDSRTPQPLVSVVVPCRNEEASIESCVRSILSQESYPGDMEVIIHPASDDNISAIPASLAQPIQYVLTVRRVFVHFQLRIGLDKIGPQAQTLIERLACLLDLPHMAERRGQNEVRVW